MPQAGFEPAIRTSERLQTPRLKAVSHYPSRFTSVRLRSWARKVDVTSQVCACWIPIVWTVLRLLHCTCNECCLFLSSKMDEKLIELVRKCEELYDMSHKKYSECLETKIPTYTSFYHSQQHFSLLHLTKAVTANCLLENEWRCMFDGNNRRPPTTCCSGR